MKITKPKEPKGPKVPSAPVSDFDENQHYYPLQCGHLANLDTDAAYRTQSSPRGKLFCEKCGKWKKSVAKPQRPELPEIPLF